MAKYPDLTERDFITDIATNPSVPDVVRQTALAFVEVYEAEDSKRIGNRARKAVQSVNARIPRVKFYLPETEPASAE